MSSLFKRAAVRGIAHELVARGAARFPTKEAMEAASDAVADGPAAAPMPDMSGDHGHDPQQVVAVAQKLIQIGEALMQQAAGGATPGAESQPPPQGAPAPAGPEAAAAGAADVQKEAASHAVEDVAAEHAVSLMKIAQAEEAEKRANKMVGLGEHANTPQAAAKTDPVAELDLKQRPDGEYHEGVGQTKLESKQTSGTLEAHPKKPAVSPGGSNSVTEDQGKHAAYTEMKKIANKLVGLHAPEKNDLANAAKHDTVAELDKKRRPEGKYMVGPGGANKGTPAAARIGHEEPHSESIGAGGKVEGTNSVTRVSNGGGSKVAEEMSAADKARVELFKEAAEDVGPYLPASLSDDEKVAAIQSMVFLDQAGRQAELTKLHEKVAAATSTETPAAEASTKQASLVDQLRAIATQNSKK